MKTTTTKINFQEKNDYYPLERIIYEGMFWKEKALEFIPEVKERIDKLKGMVYPGYGFHYAFYDDIAETERQIRGLTEETEWCYFIIAHVRLESLMKELTRAESRALPPEEYWRKYDFG